MIASLKEARTGSYREPLLFILAAVSLLLLIAVANIAGLMLSQLQMREREFAIRKWHASQEITELPKRQLRLRLRLNSIEEAERWVLSWGKHATVVRPQALANRLREVGTALEARYRQLPESFA